ncbi:MAG: PQQ-dependent sugar dehydrogenase, partial [Cyclobacteriaceae bacterium]|nr:PQQ-dependent sugar dehydrogenase [Cyclobacteriaceae bacterium]
FGPDGLLYLSVGDNTNPFASDGYSPSDEQEGRFIWDAQKSSANTNDLRGKVLRIKPEEDGTYSIPEGNLFPVGTAGTRPEIYAMGLRNPFRISIDSKTNYLYWGDVGPDAGSNNETRGPKGLDEINQARKPGNWGWPYTRGNNQVYWDYDFDAGKAIGPFDPNNLINNSPNNTGLEKLPPAQPSMIWYGYDKSEEFPWVGTGGKNPMAGPVYHSDQYEGMENRFPDYFEGKLFFYEWIRDWIYIITFDEEHNYKKAERFMPSTRFNNPMDMLFGKDGNLYILEYGEKWTSRNMDARLTKISYVAGNRTPIARITTNKVVGATPLTIEFSAAGSLDLENDDLTYSWTFEGDGPQAETPEATYTFNNPGVYNATLTVKDSEGLSASTNVEIIAGNEPPVVQIDIPFEKYFYSNGEQSVYKVIVKDQEDGSNQDGSIPADNIKVTLAYLPEGQDLVQSTIGHQPDLTPRGLRLINGSDCKACHGEAEKINGPSYRDIAAKYSSVEKDYLINKVLNGGAGVWGETPMAAHPQHNRDEVAEMINYILSLKDEGTRELAMSGTLKFDMHDPENEEGIYILTASYTDRGNGEITALSSQKQLIFRFPALEAENANQMSNGVTRGSSNGRAYLNNLKHGSHFMFEDVIMDGLKNISVDMLFGRNKEFSGTVIIRKGSVDGEELGRKSFQYFHPEEYGQQLIKISIPALSGRENIFFILEGEEGTEKEIGNVNRVVLGY